MSGIWQTVLSLTPYHLLSYGTLLGTELYQVRGFPVLAIHEEMSDASFRCVDAVPVFPSLSLGLTQIPTLLELRHDQNLFPGPSNGPIHDTPKTRFSGVLPTTSRSGGLDRSDTSSNERGIPDRLVGRLCASCCCTGDICIEHAGIWTEDTGGDD